MPPATDDPAAARSPRDEVGSALAARLHSLAVRLLRHVRVDDRRSGLSPARLSALSVLVFGGPKSVGELAEVEQVRAPTMSRLVSALEDGGLVRREPHPEDGRSVIVQATESGTRVLEEGRDRRIGRMASLLGRLDGEERDRVGAACASLGRALAGGRGDDAGAGRGGS